MGRDRLDSGSDRGDVTVASRWGSSRRAFASGQTGELVPTDSRRLARMSEASNTSVTLRLKPDRRQITRSGSRRHTDGLESLGGFQPHAALWMRIAATLTRLREATAIANAQRARSVLLRERARKLSVHLASTIALP